SGQLVATQLPASEQCVGPIMRDFDASDFEYSSPDVDIFTHIERGRTEITRSGAALHAGRSRNDQVALDLRLYCRDAATEAVAGLAQLIDVLAARAAAHAAWLMPGYTHVQRAQPVTVGHHLLAHAEPLLRDARRFRIA